MEKRIIEGTNSSDIQGSVAIYARQSVDKKDSISIEQQIEDCINQYKALHYAGNVFVYSDKGFSGKNTERPDFRRMMEDIEDGKISTLYIYKLDRISRNLADFLNMQNVFKENNVSLNSIHDKLDTSTAMGKAMINILMVFAQLERENTQLRVYDNYYSRIQKDGRWPGGKPPYGFSLEKINGISTLVPVSEEIEVVKYIFDQYLNTPSISLGGLATILREKGYVGKKGSSITNVTVGRILRNPIYVKADNLLYNYLKSNYFTKGNDQKTTKQNFMNDEKAWDGTRSAMVVNKRPSSHGTVRTYTDYHERKVFLTNIEGFIDSQTYIAVQEKLANNKQLARSNKLGKLQELTGLLKCASCGMAVKTYSFPALNCYGNMGLHKCTVKFNPRTSSRKEFQRLQANIGLCVTKYYSQLLKAYEKIDEYNQKIEKQIEEKNEAINKLLVAFANSDSPTIRESMNNQINKMGKEIDALKLEITYSNQTQNKIKAKENLNYFSLSTEEKKEILNTLIDKILLHSNYEFEIVWKDRAIQRIEESLPIDFYRNGRVRIKEDLVKNINADELNDIIYEAVGVKIDAIKVTCELNNISIPDDFFDVYSNKEKFIERLNKMSKLLKQHKKDKIQRIYDLAEKYPPKLFEPEEEIAKLKERTHPNSDNFIDEAIRQFTADKKIILSLASKQKKKRKKQAEIINLANKSDVEFFYKLHERDSSKELKETLETVDFQDVYNQIQDKDINYLSTYLLFNGIVEDYEGDISPNERLTLAFALLLPFIDNLDNAHFYDLSEYLEIYKLIAM